MEGKKQVRFFMLGVLAVTILLIMPVSVQAAGVADNHTVLILSSSVVPVGSPSCWEAVQATALGFTVEFANNTQWAAKSQADFSTYRALILGDGSASTSLTIIQAAIDNRTIWGPAVNGNIILIGGDPEYHATSQAGARTLIQNGINFAGDIADKTGLYIAFTYYHTAPESGTTISWLDQFGTFVVRGISWNDIHMVASHPALTGLTDANLSNWGSSTHEGFTSFPASFSPLAIQRNATGNGALTFGDGSSGTPFLLARGEGLQPVGLNISKSGPATASVNDNITYTITYGNTGGTTATNVIIADPLPTGTTFVSATAGGSNISGTVTWNIASLAAGVTGQTVQFTVHITTGGTITNSNYTIAADAVTPVSGASVTTTVSAPTSFQVGFSYSANGHLNGNLVQIIDYGQDCTPVTAIPDLGYRFQEWSGNYNGSDNPLTIRNVTANMTINAVFINDPPQVVIVSPANGSQAYGVMTVKANVTDDTRIARVEFYADGKLQEQSAANKIKSHSSNESDQYVFTWNVMNFSVDNHVLRVVAYDDANAIGSDEITVKVAKVKLELLAERREAQAFSILRQYGQIQFLAEDFALPVAQYRILRKKGTGNFELLKTVTPAELQNGQFQMQDKYLEKGTAYTYRVEAYNVVGQLIGISPEKTI
jgi:uncharacterized repeat protein (TIGR01451 family)